MKKIIIVLLLSLFLYPAAVFSQTPEYFHQKGLEYYNQRNYKAAIDMWKKELELNPKNPWPYFDIGVAYEYMGELAEAFEWKNKAVELEPKNGRFYWGAGLDLAYNQGWPRAVDYFKKALSLGYVTAEVYGWLSECYFQMGNMKEAEKNLIEALKVNPSYSYALNLIGEGKRFPGITQDTVKKFEAEFKKRQEEAIKKMPKAERQKLIDKEKRREQLLAQSKAIEQEKKQQALNVPFYIKHARALVFLFVLFLFVAVSLAKPWYAYYRYAGTQYFNKGDYENASLHFEKLFEYRGGALIPYEKLKIIYLKLGRKDEKAVLVFEKIYKENPEDKEIITALAEAYAKEGT